MNSKVVESKPIVSVFNDLEYSRASGLEGETALHCTLYMPQETKTRPPLLVWFHGGGFVRGHHNQYGLRKIGTHLAEKGIGVACVQYRLKARVEDLSDQLRNQMAELETKDEGLLQKRLSNARALAAMEDGLRFLKWADMVSDEFGWNDKRILGGNSAGGVTALNLAFTAPTLNLDVQRVDGVFCASGSYTYPSLVSTANAPSVMALHSPDDDRVSISGVRALKARLGDRMELLESDEMIHGKISLTAQERPRAAFRRLARFVWRASEVAHLYPQR